MPSWSAKDIISLFLLKGFPGTCNVMMFIVYGFGVGDFTLFIRKDLGKIAAGYIWG
jgi:hypothetical protein